MLGSERSRQSALASDKIAARQTRIPSGPPWSRRAGGLIVPVRPFATLLPIQGKPPGYTHLHFERRRLAPGYPSDWMGGLARYFIKRFSPTVWISPAATSS